MHGMSTFALVRQFAALTVAPPPHPRTGLHARARTLPLVPSLTAGAAPETLNPKPLTAHGGAARAPPRRAVIAAGR
jgi:hypothetical protein